MSELKWWHCALIAAILSVIFGLPFPEYRTQELLPIRSLQAERTENGVHIVSEVGEGYGANWLDAIENLRANAAGDVFFDTAEHAVFTELSLATEAAHSGILRPAAQVYLVESLLNRADLNAYLTAHPSGVQISDLERK